MASQVLRTKHFLTSLDVNESFPIYDGVTFNSGIYKTQENIGYVFKIIGPTDDEFEKTANLLGLLTDSRGNPKTILARVPVILEIETKYFRNNTPNRLSSDLARFINHALSVIEHIYLTIGLPRYRLDGRLIFLKSDKKENWENLDYESSEIPFEEIFHEYSLMGDQGHSDIVDAEIANPESIETGWRLLVDAIRYYYEQNYREVIVNCCTALELEISPEVQKWLYQQTVTQPKDVIRNTVLEMGNHMRFEIYFKNIGTMALKIYSKKEREEILLSDLKALNTIRNNVVHAGYVPSQAEAYSAILAAGKFLRALWIHRNPFFYKFVERYEDE